MKGSNQHRGKSTLSQDILRTDLSVSGQVIALYSILCDTYGTDHLVLKASKLEALELLRSEDLAERVLGLQRVIYEDPTLECLPEESDIPGILETIQDKVADLIARRYVEDDLERRIMEKMQQRQNEYLEEIKMLVLKENTVSSENAQTLKRLALLEKKEQTKLTSSVMEILRPTTLEEVIGQERGVKALLSKIASPFPQHILIYGPPGVGKTSAARLALEEGKKFSASPFRPDAPFIEANGATLRWDSREVTNPLLGSVHDPIYQGAKREFAETGIPEPKLGLVSDANGGVLFIDEIGEMDPILLNKLMKVLEDKRVVFESSYYDPHDENVPQYIKKLFENGAPADFVLIGATTRDPEELNPALRSRCAEVFFEPLTPVDIQSIVRNAASKLQVGIEEGVPEIISEYVVEGRKANNVLADAFSLALYKADGERDNLVITCEDVYEVVQNSRLVPYVTHKIEDKYQVGCTYGLGVSGFMGSVIEIEAVAFPAKNNEGKLRFNETAGPMAKDSFFNAAAVIRRITGEELCNYDVHVNIVGGGRIDGPSAGCAILLAMVSAIAENPLLQSVAMTGEISIQGQVKPVGGITEKIYGAKLAGIKTVLIPEENKTDVPVGLKGIEVIPVSTVEDIIEHTAKEPIQFRTGAGCN